MTVQELQEELARFDAQAVVIFRDTMMGVNFEVEVVMSQPVLSERAQQTLRTPARIEVLLTGEAREP